MSYRITLAEFYKICDSIKPTKRGCLIWPGLDGKYRSGVPIEGKSAIPARLVLERKLGRPINGWLMACHHCDVPRCVNPDHIYEGTARQNRIKTVNITPMYRKVLERRAAATNANGLPPRSNANARQGH